MKRRGEAVSTVALLTVLLGTSEILTGCCQNNQPCDTGGFGPSTGMIVAIGVAAGATIGLAGTAVAVHHHNEHTLKGCVSTGPNGLQLLNDKDKKTYSLIGVTADIKAGEKLKLDGEKQRQMKKHKGDPDPVNREFLVKKTTKDLGACQLVPDSQTPTAMNQ